MAIRSIALLFVLPWLCISAQNASATTSQLLVTTAAAPGAYITTVSNSSVETFNGLATPANPTVFTNSLTWAGVGTFTGISNNNIQFDTADQFGGAPNPTNSATNTSYLAAFTASGVKLTLNSPASYFGMWWSAGDAANVLTFYSGGTNGTKIATFTAGDLSLLSSAYNGNPTTEFNGQDSSEKFTFLNFYAQMGTSFDTVVASEPGSGAGFESDNWTIRNAAYGLGPGDGPTDPGTPLVQYFVTNGVQTMSTSNFITAADTVAVPEPSQVATSILLLMGISGFLIYRKQKAGCANPCRIQAYGEGASMQLSANLQSSGRRHLEGVRKNAQSLN